MAAWAQGRSSRLPSLSAQPAQTRGLVRAAPWGGRRARPRHQLQAPCSAAAPCFPGTGHTKAAMLDLVSEPQEPTPELLSQNPQTGKSRFVTNVGDATNMGADRDSPPDGLRRWLSKACVWARFLSCGPLTSGAGQLLGEGAGRQSRTLGRVPACRRPEAPPPPAANGPC